MAVRLISIVALLVTGVVLFRVADASPSLSDWVASNTSPAEKTACVREESGEYFFIAMAGRDKVRLGSRLDLSGYKETHEFSVAWLIRGEKATSIVAKVRPESIKQRYVKEGPRIYAENIEYQTLNTLDSTSFRVEVKVKKCAVRSDDSQTCKSGQKVYTVKVCEITL